MPVPNIVGITGYAQHGKNTAGEVLEDLGYRPMAFAEQLRKLATIVNPVIFYSPSRGNVRYNEVLGHYGYEKAKVLYPEVRRFLQDLGTGVRDTVGENAWVAALTKQLMPGVKYVITDVRFPNEAKAITNVGGEVWRVVRPGFDNGLGTDHPSEAFIAELPDQATLVNMGTVEDLRGIVKSIVGARGLA